MTFEKEERIAFARIISDLIEADFIVEEDEMESLDQIIVRKESSEEETLESKDKKEKKEMDKHFRISMSMLSEAKTMTFAEAVSTLQKVKSEEGKKIMMDRLYKTSVSDGTCVPLEALQIMAVKYALEGKGQVFSIPSGSSFIENMKVLYIENEDETVNLLREYQNSNSPIAQNVSEMDFVHEISDRNSPLYKDISDWTNADLARAYDSPLYKYNKKLQDKASEYIQTKWK